MEVAARAPPCLTAAVVVAAVTSAAVVQVAAPTVRAAKRVAEAAAGIMRAAQAAGEHQVLIQRLGPVAAAAAVVLDSAVAAVEGVQQHQAAPVVAAEQMAERQLLRLGSQLAAQTLAEAAMGATHHLRPACAEATEESAAEPESVPGREARGPVSPVEAADCSA